ncbi:uncharacterized protein LOC127242535 isoform X2 [Andrographis paniculata]|uniref:uncharacterized protein LOC127242535 isoform X2 n=1 Tax=Andrographis paniculata TaxID=175694 RepID=UPI0021E75EA3|nr:uncharacterized protein LOC127242535 isoform X2 [Andrographis paniculata]
MSQHHYRSPFGDTTLTKVFVGGLAWETPTAVMRGYFEQFGEILEAVIINDKDTEKSKGYGFVTFGDPESARRACADPNPVIDGRRANCNIASLGRRRRRLSSPRGRNHAGSLHQGGLTVAPPQAGSPSSYSYPVLSPPPASPAVIYPQYGYSAYPSDYTYHQAIYYNQVYGGSPAPSSSSSPSSSMATPYLHGYSTPPAQHIQGTPYLYYPAQMGSSSLTYAPHPNFILQPMRIPPFTSPSTGETLIETEAGPGTTSSTNSSTN